MTRLALLLTLLSASACTADPAAGVAPTQVAPAESPALTTEAPVADTVEVFDARESLAPPLVDSWAREPALIEAQAAARRYWQTQDMDWAWAFEVLDLAEGAFTGPGKAQAAVLYRVGTAGACCVAGGLAIVQDGRLVRNVALGTGGNSLRSLPDVDGDGRDEIVFVGGGTGQGYTETSVFVEQLGDSGMERWGQAFVYRDNCGASEAGSATATRLLVVPGPTPAFVAERFENATACDGPGTWTPAGPREAVTLEVPLGEPAVEL